VDRAIQPEKTTAAALFLHSAIYRFQRRSCFDKLSTNGGPFLETLSLVHPEPVEG
jgi:hypothetical protein